MDAIKEIYEAYSQRIKSPFFGYIFLAFLLLNWKSIYFLFLSGEPVLDKFKFVDENLGWISAFVAPIFLGVAAALAKPHLSLWGAIWAEGPIQRQKIREVKIASELSKFKGELLQEQNKAVESLISAAEQDAKVADIKDEQLRNELQSQIDDIRNRTITTLNTKNIDVQNVDVGTEIRLLEKQAEIMRENGEIGKAQEYLDHAVYLARSSRKD